jgi:hypothetical protein
MARTLYKGPPLGKLPPCLICAGPGEGARERLHLTHGVTVWLCAAHRSPAFLARRAGRDLAASLGALWSGAGCLTTRRQQALSAHLRRVRQRPDLGRPGSYAWPELRREAERRFRAGEPPAQVIEELRARHRADRARVPSARTMRRWFHDGRWLPPGADRDPPRGWAPSRIGDGRAGGAGRPAIARPRPAGAPRIAAGDDGRTLAPPEAGVRAPDPRRRAPPGDGPPG